MNKLIVAYIGDRCSKVLPLSLDSIKDVADKIVFVWGMEENATENILMNEYNFSLDPKSKRHVIERRYEHEHKGANGRARNAYLDFIKKNFEGDYCIVLDPDEIVQNAHFIQQTIDGLDTKRINEKEENMIVAPHMRHLIGDLAHEDSTRDNHFAPGRFFRITKDVYYDEKEHPVLRTKNYKEPMPIKGFTIWHMAHAMEMFNILHRYNTHQEKSQIHTKEFLQDWYRAFITGDYPVKKVPLHDLPESLKEHFKIDECVNYGFFDK